MKKILGMVDDNSVTHFLSVELNGIDEVCSAIDDSFSYKIDRTISCEVLNRKLYSLGKYQDDILHGRAQVLKASIVKIDKKQQKDNFIDEVDPDIRMGLVNVSLLYPSQISKIIKNTFYDDVTYGEYKLIDLTDLAKFANKISKTKNNFSYDGTIDAKVGEFSSASYYNYLKDTTANKPIWLNKKERQLTSERVTDIFQCVSECLDIKYLGSSCLDDSSSIEKEKMNRFALRNGDALKSFELSPLLSKILNTLSGIEQYRDISYFNISLPNYLLDGKLYDENEKSLAKSKKM